MTRQRGTSVEMLDYEMLAAACQTHGLQPPGYGTNGILRSVNGRAVIISSEGVGSKKHTDGMIYLDTEALDWQCLPLDVAEECRTGETRDLADVIRTFGSRLDVNHYQWAEWARGGDL